jgi:cbb3-type cytochrome oxidase subunit 3
MLNTFIRKCTNALEPYCVSMTYPGEGVADFACDSTSTNTVYTVRQTATDGVGDTTSTRLPTVAAGAVTIPTGSSSSSTRKTTRKLAIGVIVGIVVAVLFLLFFVIVGVFMFLKKKKKAKQIADNAQIVANAQANRPQSQFQPPPPPPPQMPTQSPQPTGNGYFSPPTQQEQKYGHTSVHEYSLTPISNPSTPAPTYAQPYMAPNAPPMPQQHTGNYNTPNNGAHEAPSPVQYMSQYQPPANGAHEVASPDLGRQPQQQQHGVSPMQQYSSPIVGAHEVDAISTPHAPGNTTGRPVYEMGGR